MVIVREGAGPGLDRSSFRRPCSTGSSRHLCGNQINAFEIDDSYLFKHYFEQDEVFTKLRRYYTDSAYRFEVPANTLTEVQALLEDHFFKLTVVADVEPFCVVKRKYTEHPDLLFKASVLECKKQDYNVYNIRKHRDIYDTLAELYSPSTDEDSDKKCGK